MGAPSCSRTNKNEVERLGRTDYDTKVKLLSLLSPYPKKWVADLIPSVGASSLKDAKLAAELNDQIHAIIQVRLSLPTPAARCDVQMTEIYCRYLEGFAHRY